MSNTAAPPPNQPTDFEQQARDLVAEARGLRTSLLEGHQEALARYENALWRGAWETGYNQGWKDAYAYALQEFEQRLRSATPPPAAARPEPVAPQLEEEDTGDDGPTAAEIVLSIVAAKPGLRGVEIVAEADKAKTPVKERTVRTALHRLKNADRLKNVDERWYLPDAVPPEGL
jgi:hypothetical protein